MVRPIADLRYGYDLNIRLETWVLVLRRGNPFADPEERPELAPTDEGDPPTIPPPPRLDGVGGGWGRP